MFSILQHWQLQAQKGGTSKGTLHNELVLNSRWFRRWFRKLAYFYKICNWQLIAFKTFFFEEPTSLNFLPFSMLLVKEINYCVNFVHIRFVYLLEANY